MSAYVVSGSYLSDIADAIRAKTGTSDTMTIDEMPQKIIDISGGNFDNVNVTAADVLSPKIFVDKEGNEQFGTMPTNNLATPSVQFNDGVFTSTVTQTAGYVAQTTSSNSLTLPDSWVELNFEVVGGTTQPSGGGDTLTWDGNTEGLENIYGSHFRVADVALSLDDLSQGGIVTTNIEGVENIPFTADNLISDAYENVIYLDTEVVWVVLEDGANIEGVAVNKGVYFMGAEGVGHVTSLTIPGYTGFGGKPIKENTIWVNTDAAITEWELSPKEPTGIAGKVWIRTGESGKTAFNVLKKENIMVNPIRCDQYIDGVWTAKSASIYQAGEWKPFQKRLYWLGSLETELVLTNNYYASLVEGTDSLSFTDTNDMAESWWRFGEVLDGTYKTLYVNITSKTGRFDLEVRNGTSHTSTKLATTGAVSGTGTFSLDISSITNGYVFFLVFLGTTVVNKLWLE